MSPNFTASPQYNTTISIKFHPSHEYLNISSFKLELIISQMYLVWASYCVSCDVHASITGQSHVDSLQSGSLAFLIAILSQYSGSTFICRWHYNRFSSTSPLFPSPVHPILSYSCHPIPTQIRVNYANACSSWSILHIRWIQLQGAHQHSTVLYKVQSGF